jgi:hypothetical protein
LAGRSPAADQWNTVVAPTATSPMLGSSSSVVMSPGPISLMPALSRPRSEKFFITAVAVLPAGMNTMRASGFASLTRCMYAAQSGFCSGTRTFATTLPPPALKDCVNACSASWPGPKSETSV